MDESIFAKVYNTTKRIIEVKKGVSVVPEIYKKLQPISGGW